MKQIKPSAQNKVGSKIQQKSENVDFIAPVLRSLNNWSFSSRCWRTNKNLAPDGTQTCIREMIMQSEKAPCEKV